jgi:integrase
VGTGRRPHALRERLRLHHAECRLEQVRKVLTRWLQRRLASVWRDRYQRAGTDARSVIVAFRSRQAFRVWVGVGVPDSAGVEEVIRWGSPARRAMRFDGRTSTTSPWVETVKKIGAPGLHFHDLRHTGNHLAARTGATTKDLMARMGHDDMRAALIYQHATGAADRQIAERSSGLVGNRTRVFSLGNQVVTVGQRV